MSIAANVFYDKYPSMVDEHSDKIHVATYGLQYSMHNFIYRFVITRILYTVSTNLAGVSFMAH